MYVSTVCACSVQVLDLVSGTTKCTIPKPKTRHLKFSPQGTYLALWEPYQGELTASLVHPRSPEGSMSKAMIYIPWKRLTSSVWAVCSAVQR